MISIMIQFMCQFYNSFIDLGKMRQRKAWTEQQDNILKEVYQKREIKKWSEIAKIMEKQFNIKGRNGKQCRQRYHNHLDDSIKHEKWQDEEQKELIKHHNEIGNRWAEISKFLVGRYMNPKHRSENDIKNQFYSILRRGLRQINIVIRKELKRYKQIQISVLNKIVQACQKNHKGKTNYKSRGYNFDLKRTILHYSFNYPDSNDEDLGKIKKFIEKVKQIGKKKTKTIEVFEGGKGRQSDDDIESEELRDDCPIDDIKKDQPQLKFRKNSFFNFTLEQPEVEVQTKNQQKCPWKLRKRSSFCSNHSLDISSPKWNELIDPFKSFQIQQTDNFSPKPQFYATSPYFDQTKSVWNQQLYH